MSLPRALIACLFFLFAAPVAVSAQEVDLPGSIAQLAQGKLKDRAAKVEILLKSGDPRVATVLNQLAEGTLYYRKSDKKVFLTEKTGKTYALTDPLTGEEIKDQSKSNLKKIKANNSLRRTIRDGLSLFALSSSDPDERMQAAETVFKSKDPIALPLIEARLLKEEIAEILSLLNQAKSAIVLSSADMPDTAKLEAISILRTMGGRGALTLLSAVEAAPKSAVAQATQLAITSIERRLSIWDAVQNIWYGLSLGSVLLLASIGLAITFGVMGVINMAHGEMVMIGAYTTFAVQQAVQIFAPGLTDYSLLLALPAAFLAAGLVGLILERGIIRFLYGRPLETLLATWGVSLVLQQTVRTIFGPSNKEVVNPSWMSGAVELAGLSLTWNRIWIFFFALAVFGLLFLLLKRTPMGLQMRAVTQNRKMASSMGIRTPWVDAFTFALGSGIAGVAGVALSQIGNVSPNLGQSYIIDSFMVVVFGGVGNLWGTLIGAITLGVANKFLEPFAGAVLGKIFVLVFIILFIQKRPRGLFALKGRSVEQ
ncbi:urea ABC transporter permease subunit UrtB [Cohaesibacter celericrescens]|uniref:Urea ABC transporter permease subunit UrtB n=1 Tax=Cohaesibacter celericrescens TaxID=2067669 RepID=A0A2N5XUM7_9HYPH|nr:urea ABC transporter permease subunit UrtB [Cohaesibacter celericrescens]PLW78222.1 urea ABC transporter permease subunit UrtB [Cohaesibacter celericrescens]